MSEKSKNTQTAPVLTLEPSDVQILEAAPLTTQGNGELAAPLDDSSLTDEEKETVATFAEQIDLSDSALVMQYGAATQKKMADFSEKALENVRSQDLGEIGTLLTGVVGQIKGLTVDDGKNKGIFKKAANKLSNMKTKYAKAEANINEVCQTLEGHQVQLLKDSAMLDQMYDMNLTYFKELTMYILAGQQKLAETRACDIPKLQARAQETGLTEDAQAAQDLSAMCDRFEKKLHDLELTRMVSLQTGPQLRLVQNNDTQMAEKIQSTLVNTIPLWKSQMTIALGLAHSTQAAEAQRQVTDMTNELLKKNAEQLQIATVETAKETERGIVDIETLKSTNEMLISTLDDVVRIQEEGRQKRAEAEQELRNMENDLKGKLLEMSAKGSRA